MSKRSGPAMIAAMLLGGLVAVTPAAASTPKHYSHYVALGDSYSAGPLIAWQQASWCFRSNNNYPSWLATKLGLYHDSAAFKDVTCSSADTSNMKQSQPTPSPDIHLTDQSPQFDALDLNTDLVTIGIGGNDSSVFGDLVYTCPGLRDSDPTGAPCKQNYTVNGVDTVSKAIEHTERSLEKVFKGVHTRSPGATIVVVGYPRLVPPQPGHYCPDTMPFADGDYAWADSVERELNNAEATAARRQHATFVDTYSASLGHDACAGDAAWVRGKDLSLVDGVAYHPNKAGMEAEANLVFKALGPTSNTSLTQNPQPRAVADKQTVTRMAKIADAGAVR